MHEFIGLLGGLPSDDDGYGQVAFGPEFLMSLFDLDKECCFVEHEFERLGDVYIIESGSPAR